MHETAARGRNTDVRKPLTATLPARPTSHDRLVTPRVRLRASSIRVLVVGDDELSESLKRVAMPRGRRVVGKLCLGSPERPPLLQPGDTNWDELVIDERLFDDARASHPGLIEAALRVWVVPRTEEPSTFSFSSLPRFGRVMKRTLDIIGASIGLLLTLPLLLLALAAVKADSKGPAFFSQVRLGRNRQRFRLYKIRTMATGNSDERHREYYAALVRGQAESQEGTFKLLDDPRITRVGRILRRYSIDELPQLWNVLRGDMSLVGPRPMQPHELELCDAAVWHRLAVRPGLTGLWQVSGRCRLTFAEMVALDVEYWRSWNILGDLKILAKTPGAVLRGDGAA